MKSHPVLVLAIFLATTHAHAQGVRPMAVPPGEVAPAPGPSPSDDKKGTGRQAEPASVTPCGVFLWNNPSGRWLDSTADGLTATAQRIADCVKGDVEAATEIATDDTAKLVRRHVNYKQYKRWANAIVHASMKLPSTATELEARQMREVVDGLGKVIHDALEAKGLNNPLTAMLFTGASVADAGEEAGENGETSDDGKKPDSAPAGPSAFIAFESPHFGDDEHRPFHVAFGGRIGFQQIMTMVKPVADEGGTPPDDQSLVADYKDGLMWSVGATAYALSRGKSEAFVRLSLGGTRIGDTRSVLEGENGEAFIAVPANAEASTSAPRWEIGIGWNYYGRPMEVAHLEKGLLNPAFSAYVVQRRDRRFKREGDLADFQNPERRWIYGISVNLRNLIRSDGGEVRPSRANTFDFGFSVEREFASGSGLRIPNSTRYVLRGEVNLLRALAGAPGENGAKEDKAAPTEKEGDAKDK